MQSVSVPKIIILVFKYRRIIKFSRWKLINAQCVSTKCLGTLWIISIFEQTNYDVDVGTYILFW